ncbi:class I SAM-dependent methyltransferase [Halorarius halobius]|uniref:class I SAM-dependent methyltransferase n=1 Tax=Halorarius halobius TaxID=2962671 RepID=UPI0020CB855E|nr:class I SAM-dependent methyltransferase [Halorarius halobius]
MPNPEDSTDRDDAHSRETSAVDDPARRTRRTYETVAERYHERTGDIDALVPEVERLCERLPDSPRVLDAGCGPGRDAAHLRDAGARVVGLDVAAAQLHLGREEAPGARFAQGDLRALPLATDSVDGVWAAASLLHVPREDVDAALSELHRVTRPGGALFASLKPGDGDELTHGYGTDEGRYFVFHDPETFADRVRDAGFAVDRLDVEADWFRLSATA